MHRLPRLRCRALSLLLLLPAWSFAQPVVINEVMYHPLQPALGAEPLRQEFIELYNRSGTNVNLNGWRFSKGITYTFTNLTLVSGAYVVVSPSLPDFTAAHPGITNVVGPWSGTLGNNGETIELKDAAGDVVDTLSYGTEGDWAQRQRGPDDLSHRGWKWYSPADGLGKSMELRNPNLGNNQGQNWAASGPAGGTPGRINSAYTNNVAPLILNVAHSPLVPKSSETVAITARIVDELASGFSVTLFWRVDSTVPPAFTSATMADDGGHGDGANGDGIYGALIPAQANNTVVEFYVQATDSGGRGITWPRPVIAAPDGTGPTGQVANALYQVDDNPLNLYGGVAVGQPVYKLIMTAAEQTELAGIPCSGSQDSDAEMNGTWITFDGLGAELRYVCGFRNRGHGSRCATPPNYRINIPTDNLWKGQRALNLNSVNTPSQIFGSTVLKKAGLAGADSRAAQVRVNNVNRASTGTGMLGAYAANEELDTVWAGEHFPNDSAGNIYRAIRDIAPSDWVYRGTNVSSYINTYFKTDNSSAYDWSDLIQLHRIVGTNDLFTTANIRQVANVEQWMLYYATMTISGNSETSPNGGYNDDYFMYAGVTDPRFILMYYDNDSMWSGTFGAGSTSGSIFGAEANNGMGQMTTRFLEWPDFKPIYYATLQRLLDTTFSQPEFDALIDEVFRTYPASTSLNTVVSGMKSWMAARRASVQSQIAGLVPAVTNSPVATISGEPRSPTPFTTATLTVAGNGITAYKWKLNNGAYSAEVPVATPITLSGLPNNSSNTVFVIGKNSNGIYQSVGNATVSRSWVVKTGWPTVRLNEVLARNVTALNHNGTFPDAIELFNEGPATVDLSGLRLTDDTANPGQFTFPSNTTLAAGSYLVVYANNVDGTPGIHLGFSLGQDGDGVYLFDRATNGGALLDSVVFGLQIADKSIGRLSGGEWSLCQATPGAANTLQPLGDARKLKINEWLTAGALPYLDDFIEIYNGDSLPVAMGGLYLTDEPIGAPAMHSIAALSFIQGGGHAAFIADGNAAGGANHLNFSLSSELGELALNAADSITIDSVSYGPQRIGIAQGRCPDGAVTNIVFLAGPTPGGFNACPPSAPPAAPPPVLVNLLPLTNSWRYLQSNNLDGINWQAPAYNDSAWPSGQALLGVIASGSVPETIRTPLTVGAGRITYYFRSTFTVPPNFNPTSLQFSNVIDDGAVFYLNGREVARYNMPSGTVTNQTVPLQSLSGPPPWTGPIQVPVTNVTAGVNSIAVEVHNAAGSADVVMGTRLDGVFVTNSPPAPGAGSVVINEVLANNAGIHFPDGTTPDYIELYNPTTNAVNLGFSSLSDSPGNAQRWVFPTPTILPGGAYLTILLDPNQPPSAVNAGFGLKSTGDAIYLFASNGVPVDFVTFGLQAEDFAIGRVPSGGSNWTLVIPSAGSPNSPITLGDPANLKINEWMAAPSAGDDWFEVYNPSPQPVALGGLWLSDDLSSSTMRQNYQLPALSFIGAQTNGYQKFHADNNPAAGADHVTFKLSATGESVGISTAAGALIDGVSFGAQLTDVSEGRLPDGSASIVPFPISASPGEGNYLPLTNIVINEALSHTDLPLEDAIELKNISTGSLDISGWYLSDSKSRLKRFLIPNGTILPSGGLKVFYEYQFNDPNFPGVAFALNGSKGDQIYLSQADTNASLTGYRASVSFGAAQNGVSFGRYQTSVGADFVAMSALSFGTAVTAQSPTNQITTFRTGQGAANPYPVVGPIMVTEIMYHPPDNGTNDNVRDEFVELYNPGPDSVPLYDPTAATNTWHLRQSVDFNFPPYVSLPAGGYLLVVSFDPVADPVSLGAFQAKYGSNSMLLGPYTGKLDNGNGSIHLLKPDRPDPDGFIPYVLVEKIDYADRGAWPTNADGSGMSLQRLSVTGYGNEPTNWFAAAPTPGPEIAAFADSDHDGMPDGWETSNGFDPHNPADASLDADGDGLTNLQEYLAGTNPHDAASGLKLFIARNGAGVQLGVPTIAGRTYTILYTAALSDAPVWQRLADVPAQGLDHTVYVQDPIAPGTPRFYKIVTPELP